MLNLWGIFMTVALLSAVVMVGLILLQQGKGADMGASFGAGASGSLFGATGSANPLSKATAWAAGIFLASTLALTYIDYHGNKAAPASDAAVNSVLNTLNQPAAAASTASAPAAAPAASATVAAPAAAPASAAATAATAAPKAK
ncbi:MAG: preprotein translocase subunit SecG [Cellvibrionales bacterium]|nr:MAG: preprotein translocase subunit SecG [Cellvibrionales bacterium]